MAKQANTLSLDLISHLRRLNSTRKKLEKLFTSGEITRLDIEQVYIGLYLDAIVSFERFIEQYFISLLVAGRLIAPPNTIPRVTFASSIVARDVILGGKSYVDWLPYKFTENRAEAFFRSGLPFTSLTKAEKNTIEDFMTIRNAIAHKSGHSIKKFETDIIGNLTLPRKERTPSGFLRSIFRTTPMQTRYENLILEMAAIAQKLTS